MTSDSTTVTTYHCVAGPDSSDVEQAGEPVHCTLVDYHSGHTGWTAAARPAHICTIQGKCSVKETQRAKSHACYIIGLAG